MSSGAIRGGSVAIEIGADARRFFATLNALQARLRNVGASLTGMGARMAGLGAAVSAPFGLAIRQTAAFQDTMAAVGAVSGATGSEFDALKKKAMDLGASTSFTAQEVAEGMQALSQGGFTVSETLSGIEGTLLLARAGMLDLGDATSIAVAILRSFKMQTSDAGKVADILAMAANSSNASVQSLGEALSTVGGIASSAGTSLTEVTAAIGVLADRGMDGSEAGTALRRILIGLAQEQDKLKKMGVEVKDPKTGKLKPLKKILGELKVAMKGMDDTDRIAKLSKIFDVFGANAVLQLMNAGDALENLDNKLQQSGGSAAEVATKMDDTLGGSWRMFTSAVEGVALAIGESLTKELRSWLQYLTELASGIGAAIQRNQEWIVAIVRAGAAMSAAGVAITGMGVTLQVAAFALGGFTKALSLVLAPMGLLVGTSSLVVRSFANMLATAGSLGGLLIRASVSTVLFSASAAAMAVSYAASLVAMVGQTAMAATAIAAGWAIRATIGLAAFAAEVKARITYYTGMLSFMVARTIAQGGIMAAFWINEAARATIAFTAQFVVGAATYVASMAAMVSTTLAGAASMAAAWLAPIAPILGLVSAIAGIGVALQYAFSQGGSVASSIGALFGPMSEGFNAVLADATKVFSDLWGIANTTFAGISDALMAGDMTAAMDVLWAGLKAAWLRGQQGIMSYLDVFIEGIQNVWGNAVTFLSTSILGGMGLVERGWIHMTGALSMAWQASIDGIMGVWDTAVGAIQKAIAYIRSFFDKSIDYEAISRQIDDANKQRKDARRQGRDEMAARTDRQLQDSRDTEAGAKQIVQDENTQAQAERAKRTEERAAARQAEVDAANGDLSASRDRAAGSRQSSDLMREIAGATTTEELRAAWEEAQALAEAGLISAERLAEIEQKINDQTEELDKTRALKAQEDEAAAKAKSDTDKAAKGAGDAAAKVETAGTFSAAAAGLIGYQQTIAERTAKATEQTARNTKPREGAKVQS
jgi:TP901 family phage tail tape measure protein